MAQDFTDPLGGDVDELATAPSAIGSSGPAFAPGLFKVILEKFEHKANRAQTSLEPQATLKVFEVVECLSKPNAQAELAGASYFAANRFQTSNVDINKNNKQMVAKLISVCGKSEQWKKYITKMAEIPMTVTTGAMCAWINDNCKGATLLIKLTPQYVKPGTEVDPTKKVYFDHEYLPLNAAEVTPAREPAQQATQAKPATDNPFGA